MKLLVTADWHIGKKLHNVDLREDMLMFFDWLLETIKRERIKYFLVAGDIFDNNNPSNDSSKIYYNFLVKLDQLDCKAIIIAGNHDSPPFIDAPKELLAAHHVTVIGLFPGIQNVEQIFIPICNEKKEMVAVVAAIPFLQDRFVRQVGEGEGAKEMEEKIKQGMKALFSKIGLALREKYPNIPRIGMAHLYAQGSTTNETEREIQVGNQDGIASDDLDQFDFLALGHIHTGQTVKTGKIQYASSPISLGFTENRYNHKVLVLDIVNDKIIPSEINIPKNRSLYQLKGTMDEILNQIQVLKKKYALQVLLDINIEEEEYDPKVMTKLEELKSDLAKTDEMKIINTRIKYKNKGITHFNDTITNDLIMDLNPTQVFETLIEGRSDKNKLMEIFSTILTDLNQA
jgi:exonuclease SbcD